MEQKIHTLVYPDSKEKAMILKTKLKKKSVADVWKQAIDILENDTNKSKGEIF
ncbi:MAG: hypothetical protein ACOC3Z_03415 [Nanoarchaeota archaeon]